MSRRAATTAALSLSITVAACTSERQAEPVPNGSRTPTATPVPQASTSATTPVSTAPSGPVPPPSTAPPTSAPSGTVIVESMSLGVAFAVPETYTVLDPAELADDFFDGPAFEELATRAGLSAEEFERFLREAVSLYVFAPASSEGYVDNITAQPVEGDALPTEDQFTQTLQGLGAVDVRVAAGTVRDVPYLQGTYSLPVGSTTVYGVDTQLVIGGRAVEVTATASSQETAAELGALLLDTVRVA